MWLAGFISSVSYCFLLIGVEECLYVCNESMKDALLWQGTGEHKKSNGMIAQLASFARYTFFALREPPHFSSRGLSILTFFNWSEANL